MIADPFARLDEIATVLPPDRWMLVGVMWAEATALQGDITFAWVPATMWMGSSKVSGETVEARAVRFES